MPLDGGTCPYIQGISKRTVCWNRVSKVSGETEGDTRNRLVKVRELK